MINIKSLKRINEGEWQYKKDPDELRHESDVAKANADYQKADPSHGPLSLPRMFRNGAAAKDRELAIDAANERLKASKQGMVSKQDSDDAKFEAAKAKSAAMAKAAGKVTKDKVPEAAAEHGGFFHKLTSLDHPHPYVAAGLATVAGLAALQKRKNRLPEPGSYSN